MSHEPDSLPVRLARLPREIPPERDLWSGIDARLAGRRPAWHFGLGIAAGLAIIALSLLVSVEPRRPGGTELAGARSAAPGAPPVARESGARDANYEHTQETLERAFRSELRQLPKATQARLIQDLDVIHKARSDIRAALAANPDSPLLQALLADTWQQEMEFYANVSSTPDAAGMRWPM